MSAPDRADPDDMRVPFDMVAFTVKGDKVEIALLFQGGVLVHLGETEFIPGEPIGVGGLLGSFNVRRVALRSEA